MAAKTKLSDRRYYLGYVHLHDEEEVRKFREMMTALKIEHYDDWLQEDAYCANCGWRVDDHDEQTKECPGQEEK